MALIVVLVPLTIICGIILDKRCPKCKKIKGLKPTGNYRKTDGRILDTREEELKCSGCGHVEWQKYSRGNQDSGMSGG